MSTQTKVLTIFSRFTSRQRLTRILSLNLIFTVFAFGLANVFLRFLGKVEVDLWLLLSLVYVGSLPCTWIIQRIADKKFVSHLHFTEAQLQLVYTNHQLVFNLDSVQFKGPEKAAFFIPVDQDYVKILCPEGTLLVEVDETWSNRLDLLRYLEKRQLFKSHIPVLERDKQLSNMKRAIKKGLGVFGQILILVLALISISSYWGWALVPALIVFIYIYRDLLLQLTIKV